MSDSEVTALNRTWRFRSIPGWYGNAEHAAPMHQDFEAFEDLAEMQRVIMDAL